MRLFRRPEAKDADKLLGKWYGRNAGDPALIEFREDGRMLYLVQRSGRSERTFLTWRVDGGEIVTNQPSAPREERTTFRFDGADVVLAFGGVESRFTR